MAMLDISSVFLNYLVICGLCANLGFTFSLKSICRMSAEPDSAENIGTTFRLHNRQTAGDDDGEALIYADADSLRSSSFDKDLKTVFLVHGYRSSNKVWWMKNFRNALLEKENANIIYVDWSGGSGDFFVLSYPPTSRNTRVVGDEIANMCVALMDVLNADHKTFHIVGFSLGAQVAGAAGHAFQVKTDKTLPRITGLDAAEICFENIPSSMALDKTDADFVDVIHTDCGPTGAAMTKPIGHVDFYPHGCRMQPGCTLFSTCNHFRAPDLYVDSIQNAHTPMTGSECESYSDFMSGDCSSMDSATLGYYADPKQTGVYYLNTASEAPFGQDDSRR